MNKSRQQPQGTRSRSSPRRLTVAAATVLTAMLAASAYGQNAMKVIVPNPGGISPSPVLTSVALATNKHLQINWQAFPYQVRPNSSNLTKRVDVVYTISKCPALLGTNTAWQTVASVTNTTAASLTIDGAAGFLSVEQTPAPAYAGADACGICHIQQHADWMTTAHSGALDALKTAHSDQNASCLPCHTAGYGTPNGYIDATTTPQLAGVQCENCHGPAYAHTQNPLDPNRLPVRSPAAEVCGGCHSGDHHPTYENWGNSVHADLSIAQSEFADPVNGPGRMTTCGACHSAATRLALLGATQNMINDPGSAFNPTLPSTQEASSTSLTCATCHNPHLATTNTFQLRFPLASKIAYSYNTGTNFAANYNDQVQTCGQCHNLRGATWTATSRGPHHSPQYNILIGNGGYEAGSTNVPQSAHMDIDTQCTYCHVQTITPANVTAQTPVDTGHTFTANLQNCAPCHDEVGAGLIKDAVQSNIHQQVSEIKGLLDQWAANKAPASLTQKYGSLAWEYGSLGTLSTTNTLSQSGPSAADQKLIPDGIKQARYNLYLIENDHSYGVHNGNYTRFLLQVARDNVNAALNAQ